MLAIIKDGGKIIVRPDSAIIATTADMFSAELQSLLQESPKEIQIDLSGVEMVDSAGIETMITINNLINKAGGKLSITNASPDIYNLLIIMGLDRRFKVEQAE